MPLFLSRIERTWMWRLRLSFETPVTAHSVKEEGHSFSSWWWLWWSCLWRVWSEARTRLLRTGRIECSLPYRPEIGLAASCDVMEEERRRRRRRWWWWWWWGRNMNIARKTKRKMGGRIWRRASCWADGMPALVMISVIWGLDLAVSYLDLGFHDFTQLFHINAWMVI